MTETELVVSEIFGPTIQGEGPSAGRRAAFVRLGGCNLKCSWCDTPYTWDWRHYSPTAELRRMPIVEVAERIEQLDTGLVVVTGGEPLLQAEGVRRLIMTTTAVYEIETNGTIIPGPPEEWRGIGVRFNVSPKLPSAGNDPKKSINAAALKWFNTPLVPSRFKFVCTSLADLDAVDALVKAHHLIEDFVWIMPEGTTSERLLDLGRELADPAIARGYNLTLRHHVLLWGDTRGR